MKGGESQGEESDMFDGFEGDRERTTRELRDFCQGIRLLRENNLEGLKQREQRAHADYPKP